MSEFYLVIKTVFVENGAFLACGGHFIGLTVLGNLLSQIWRCAWVYADSA